MKGRLASELVDIHDSGGWICTHQALSRKFPIEVHGMGLSASFWFASKCGISVGNVENPTKRKTE